MKKIIIAESRKAFTFDLENRLMLEDRQMTAVIVDNAGKALSQAQPGMAIAVSESALDESMATFMQSLPAGVVAYGYCQTANGIFEFNKYGIPCMGVITRANELLNALSVNPLVTMPQVNTPQTRQQPATQPSPIQQPATQNTQQQIQQPAYQPIQPVQQYAPPQIPQNQMQPVQQAQIPFQQQAQQPQVSMDAAQLMLLAQQLGINLQQQPASVEQQAIIHEHNMHQPAAHQQNTVYYDPKHETLQPSAHPVHQQEATQPDTQLSGGALVRELVQKDEDMKAEKEFEKEFEPAEKSPTKVVSVYSAKGGVGKTTIAASLATYLALSVSGSGRGKYRVCMIDYNIDFGDVCSTLDMDPEGVNLSYWVSDIRERAEMGEKLEDIRYSRSDMDNTWLQKSEKTGLYALLAPATHEDSMDIQEEELEIMLKSIIENGEFDFVICDTGNNTRDSSVLALESSDTILMVVTQDITTANCNTAFIKASELIDLDLNKIKLVINNIMPTQTTGISISHIEEAFPYECIARIKRDESVIKANNYGTPLVYSPTHPYTKQISNIVNYLADDEYKPTLEAPKKSLFARLFKG